jgi:hypothetical protein
MLALDIYVFQGVRAVSRYYNPRTRAIISLVFWGISFLVLAFLLAFLFTGPDFGGRRIRSYFFAIAMGLFLAKLIAAMFFFTDDVFRSFRWTYQKVASSAAEDNSGEALSRSAFLSWLGLAAGSTLFGSMVYGFGNKYNYRVHHKRLTFNNLPAAFRGLRILHISDIHSGSFTDKKAVERGVEHVLSQQPDLILFTGDLVNDRASEMEPFMDVFSRLKAPLGVYSTLGNHDYGDYVQWPSGGISKEENLEILKGVHKDLGWRLLMNEHVAIEKDGHSLALIGIENWSAKANFPKHGRLDLAYSGAEKHPFKILMSHDPSHWEAEVLKHYPEIDLMLSGHTHGMQFGVEIPGFRWSPVQYFYKQWAGLYRKEKQHLYVNRGFGFIGYPGRVGILPEITVLTLDV